MRLKRDSSTYVCKETPSLFVCRFVLISWHSVYITFNWFFLDCLSFVPFFLHFLLSFVLIEQVHCYFSTMNCIFMTFCPFFLSEAKQWILKSIGVGNTPHFSEHDLLYRLWICFLVWYTPLQMLISQQAFKTWIFN